MSEILTAYKHDLEWWEQNGIDHWNTSGAGTPCVETDEGMREWIEAVQAEIDSTHQVTEATRLIVAEFKNLALHQYDEGTTTHQKITNALALLEEEL